MPTRTQFVTGRIESARKALKIAIEEAERADHVAALDSIQQARANLAAAEHSIRVAAAEKIAPK